MRLRVRDADLRYTRQVEFQSAELQLKWNGVSTFTVTCSPEQAGGLVRGSGLVFDHKGIVLSGLVRTRIRTDEVDDATVELAGRCDLWRLAGRLAYPDPTVGSDGTQPARWDQSGPAGEVLADMVDLNAGSSALAGRQIDGLVVGDADGVGETVRARRRFPVVAEEIERLGRSGGIVARLRQHDRLPELHFTVAAQRDLTRLVVFSQARGNLFGYEAETQHPETTVAIVGGPGEGADREVLEQADSDLVGTFGRWETWVDARNAASEDDALAEIDAALQDEADQHLTDHGISEAVAVDTVETATTTWRDHWDVGDLVTVEVDGQRLTRTVTEVDVTVSPGDGPDGGPVVAATPVFGEANPRRQLNMLSRLGEIERRVTARGKD